MVDRGKECGLEEYDENGQKTKISIYIINKNWGDNVHGDIVNTDVWYI